MKAATATTAPRVGVCDACRVIGVTIVDGKALAHNDRNGKACYGIASAAAPAPRAAFLPKCVCTSAPQKTCRACQIADGIVSAFRELRSPAALGIGARVAARATVIAKAAAVPPALRAMVAEGNPGHLLDATIEVARAIVEGFQAIRETAHRAALDGFTARIDAALQRQESLQLQIEAASAGHAAQVAALHAPAAAHAHSCSRCDKVKPHGYILDGKVVCRDCRGAHREEYYASRGQTARPRQDRRARVTSMTVHANAVTVASV